MCQLGDLLGVAIAAVGAGISGHACLAAGRSLGHNTGIVVMDAVAGGVAQSEGIVAVVHQSEGNLHAAGNKQLVGIRQAGVGVVQGNGGSCRIKALGHVPVGIAGGLDEDVAALGEADDQLAIDELVDAHVGFVILAAVVSSVDVANQIVIHNGFSITAVGAGAVHIVVTQRRHLVGSVAVAAARAGIGGVAALGTGGSSDRCLVAVLAHGNGVAQNQSFVIVDHQSEGDLNAAGHKHLLHRTGGIVVQGNSRVRAVGLCLIPAQVVAGLDEDVAVTIEGRDQLAIHKLVLTQISGIFLATVVRAVDVANQIVITNIAAGSTGSAHIAVARSRDFLGVAVVTDGAGERILACLGAGSGLGDLSAVIMRAAADFVAQNQRIVVVDHQSEGDLRAAGHEQLFCLALCQRYALLLAVALSHVPAQIVAGLDGNVAVTGEGGNQLAIDELVDTQISGIVIAGVILAVDEAEQVVITDVAAGSTGGAHIAVTRSRDFLGIAVVTDGTGVSGHARVGTGGFLGDLAAVIMRAAADRVAQNQRIIGIDHQSEGQLSAAGHEQLFGIALGQGNGGVAAVALSQIPAGVAGGLDEDVAIAVEGCDQLTIHELVDAHVLVIFFTTVVGTVDKANQIEVTSCAAVIAGAAHIVVAQRRHLVSGVAIAAGTGVGGVAGGSTGGSRHLRGVAVARSRDLLIVAVATDGAGVSGHASLGTGGFLGDLAAVTVGAVADGVAQHQGFVIVDHQSEGQLRATGHEQPLHRAGGVVVQGNGGVGAVALCLIPAQVVAGLDEYVAVAIESSHQLAANELIDAQSCFVTVAAVAGAVDEADQIVVTDITAGGTGRAHIAVAQSRHFVSGVAVAAGTGIGGVAGSSTGRSCHLAGIAVTGSLDGFGVAVAADGAGVLGLTGLGAGGSLGDLAAVIVSTAADHIAQNQRIVIVDHQIEGQLSAAGHEQLFRVALCQRYARIGAEACSQIPAGVVTGLDEDVAVLGEGCNQLAIGELVFTQVSGISFAAIIGTIDEANQIILTDIATAGTGGAHIAVTLCRDFLRVAVIADGASISGIACFCTGSRLAVRDDVVMGAAGDLVAQNQRIVIVDHQSEGDLRAAGHEQLFAVALCQSYGLLLAVACSQIPAGVVAGLHKDIAVIVEGSNQLAVHELVLTQIGVIFFAAVVGAVDVTNQIVLTDVTAGSTGIAHIAVTRSRHFVSGVAVAAGTTGIGGVTGGGTGGSRHLRGVAVTRSLNFLGVAVAAGAAGEGLDTGSGTGCRRGHLGSVAVTQRCGFVSSVGIITLGAGVGGVTLSGTGGSRHLRGVAMTRSRNALRLGSVTDRAGVGLDTGGGTGSRRGDHAAVPAMVAAVATLGTGAVGIVMTRGISISILIAVTAAAAGMKRIALLSTGSRHNAGGVAVALSRNRFCLGTLTGRAGVGLDTGAGASGLGGDHTVVVAVTGSRHALGGGSAAVFTGLGNHTGSGTGSRRSDLACIPVVAYTLLTGVAHAIGIVIQVLAGGRIHGVAQHQSFVGINRQSEGYLDTGRNTELIGVDVLIYII